MNQDFVSYELAVKLKEKGFNDNCHAYYEPLKHCLNFSRVFKTNSLAENYKCVTAPTISQVLKWLREEKKIHICINIYDDGWFFDVSSFYKADTGVYEIKLPYMSSNVTPDYDSYEQATLAGIKFCLNNLI